ncbi:MAG TPA: glycosyl hydrolase 115 family protein, partial [Paludibacter sp.]
KRSGGSGVYYHISYWGRPHDYLWLATTQPSLIWYEMQKAWAYGARKIWILNVGDIKPAEYLTEFYLDMAWNINSIKSDSVSQHLENWMDKTFGNGNAVALKNIMDEYYRLAFIRRPEFMGWSQTEPTTKVKPTDLNFTEFGDEITTRLKQYDKIEKQADSLGAKIPLSLKNAYFELIKYPVSGAAEMNKKWLNNQYANLFASYKLNETKLVGQKSLLAWEKIQQMTAFYNDSIENGKWKLIMSAQPRKLPVFDKPTLPEVTSTTQQGTIFWIEESNKPMIKSDTVSLVLDNCSKGIYYFNSDSFSINKKPDWLSIEYLITKENSTLPANKLLLKLVPEKMKDKIAEGLLSLSSNNKRYYVKVKGIYDAKSSQKDRCIRLKASEFTQNKVTELARWQSMEGLGYSQSAMSLQPFNAKLKIEFTQNPSLEYEFSIENADSALIRLYLLPTHPTDSNKPLRIAISIDGSTPKLFNIKTEGRSNIWKENKLRNQAIVKTQWKFNTSGKHTLRIFAVDPDVVIDQLMIDFKMDRSFYGVGE